MRPLSKATIDNIKVLLRSGKSARETARQLGVSIGPVLNVRKADLSNIPPSKVGRPSKISKTTRRYIAREFDKGELTTYKQGQRLMKSLVGEHISVRTVERVLDMEGLKTYVQQKKPSLTADQKSARLKFARDHLKWTVEDWKNVMFSDETTFCRIEPFGKKYFHMRPETMHSSPNPSQKRKQGGGGKMMFWGCITYHGVGDACRLPEGLDSELYVKILRDYVFASRDYYKLDPAKFMFQQDNSRVHTANIVQKYFRKSKMTVLEWPVNSPDLNPIETVWAYIRRELDQYETDPKDLDDLWKRVNFIWGKIPTQFLHNLYEGMPRRMQMLRRGRGEAIDY